MTSDTDTLYLRLTDPGADAPTAHTLAPPGQVSALVGTAPLGVLLAEAAARNRPVVAFLPAGETRLVNVALPVPAGRTAQATAAAPYAVEDAFADDVENLHFAAGEVLPDGRWSFAALGRGVVADAAAAFSAAGVTSVTLVPEILALPLPPPAPAAGGGGIEAALLAEPLPGWTAWVERGRVLVRSGPNEGFEALAEDLPFVLSRLPAAAPLWLLLSTTAESDITTIDHPNLRLEPGHGHLLEALVRHAPPGGRYPINLLQGAFAPRAPWLDAARAWRTAGTALLLAFAVGVGANALAAARANRDLQAQTAANEARYRELFPADSRIVDLQTQTTAQERQLGQASRASSPDPAMDVLASFAQALAATPGVKANDLQVRAGILSARLTAPGTPSVESFRTALKGVPLALGGVTTNADGTVSAEVRIGGAESATPSTLGNPTDPGSAP